MLDPRPTQRPKKNYRFKGFRLLVAVLVLAISLEILIAVIQSLLVKEAVAQWGFIEHPVSADCLILRKEDVLSSPMAGRLELAVRAGDRVRRGELLMEVIDTDHESLLTADKKSALIRYRHRLAELDRIIHSIQKELRIHQNAVRAGIPGMDPNEVIRLQAEEARMNGLRQDLIDSEDPAVKGLSRYCLCIFAEHSGVFWPALDGGESLPIGDDYLPKADDFRRGYSNQSPAIDGNIQPGQPLGKVIEGWGETIVAWVKPSELPYRPAEGGACRLMLGEDRAVDLEFTHKEPAPDGEFWFFQEESLTTELLKSRMFHGSIVTRRIFGLRIPKAVLHKTPSGWMATVSQHNRTVNLPVEVVDTDENWAVVKGLEPGTVLLYR